MNDYYKVLSEYQNLFKINQINLNNLVNISIEIQTIKNGLKLFNSNFSDNNQKENFLLPPFTTMNESFKIFYKKLKSVVTSLEDEIVFPIETLYQNNELICKENLNSFNQMANILIENKQHLNKTMEKFKQSLKENNIKTNSEDDIMKKQAKIENSKQLYKYAIEKMNKIIEESNEKYNKINKGIDANDESRMAILKEILNNYSKICFKIGEIFTDYGKSIKEQVVEKIDPKLRIQVFNPQGETKKRFQNEKYSENFEEEEKKNKEENITSFADEFELISDNDINTTNINKGKTKKEIKEQTINTINNYISILLIPKEMPLENITQIIQFINDVGNNNQKNSNATLFIETLLKKGNHINFPNLKNLTHFSNILNALSININTNKNNYDNYIINDLIIQVCEKCSCNDIYLYSLLGKRNKFYTTKTFWSQLITNKFIYSLNNQVKKIINDKELKGNVKTGKIYLLEFLELSKKIDSYNKLNEAKKTALEQFARKEIDILIKENIIHMSNFKIPRNVGLDIINDYCRKLGVNPEKKEYYIALLLTELSKNYNYKIKKSILKNTTTGNLLLLKNASLFLSNADILNLFLLNKSLTFSLKQKVFKRILNDNARTISLNKRMEIWSILLNLKSIQEKYSNYKQLDEKVKKNEHENSKNNEIIELDIVRTFFEDNIEENQKKIKNILITLNYLFPNVGYCQGMNYIAAFLLQVFDYNEEKTFYYMAGIISNTDFGKLFENDLRLLKIFFFVVEKIIQVFIPKVYDVIKKNSIMTNYFCPPWFLTLWTNVCPLFSKENTPFSSLSIIENFFADGWISVIRAGYTVLKYYENDIWNFPKEDIMHFIINQLPTRDLLKNENFETFRNEYNKSRKVIKKELIANITKIYCFEEKNNNIK
jgi:hypothetical protein